MKFTSIFFKASAEDLRGLPQRYIQTSEKYEVYFNIFQSECRKSSRFTSKINNITILFKLFLNILKDLKITQKISSPKQVHETTANKGQTQSSFHFSTLTTPSYRIPQGATYGSLRISITMCEAKGERFFTMFRMTNTLKSYILAPHRCAELTLDYKQGEQFVVFGIKQFGRTHRFAPTH